MGMGMGAGDSPDDYDEVQHRASFKEKLSNGTHKLKEKIVKKLNGRILIDVEIDNLPIPKILNTDVVELLEKGIRCVITDKIFEQLQKHNYRYICSIAAAHSLVSTFEKILKKYKVFDPKKDKNLVRRIGGIGYWHYFVECGEKKRMVFMNELNKAMAM